MHLSIKRLLLLGCTLAGGAVFAQPPLSDLSALEWERRIIVINAPQHSGPVLEQLQNSSREIDERNITWFVMDRNNLTTNHSASLSQKFPLTLWPYFSNKDHDEALLIGYDGVVKSRTNRLDLQSFFALIDTMPMRQAEIRAKGQLNE